MPKKKKELSQEQIDRLELIDYYSKVCSCEINYPLLQQTLKRLMSDEFVKYTYKGLQYALWYAKERKRMDITNIAIAAYVYDEAKAYYNWHKKMQQVVADWRLEDNDVEIIRREKEEDVFG